MNGLIGMRHWNRILLSGLVIGALAQAGRAESIFNFEDGSTNQGTPFTDTSNGLLATFSSAGDPGGFGVNQSFFSTLTGNVLIDPGPAGLDSLPLNIAFSNPVARISLDFAVNSGSPVPLTFNAFLNGASVGSVSAADAFPSANAEAPEGHITFNGASFDSVTLSSDANDFAVDNIDVITAAAIPEPGTFGLLGSAFALVGVGSVAKLLRKR